MLRNPAYAGILRAGKYSKGKFCRVGDEGLIVVENAHEPLVPPRGIRRGASHPGSPQAAPRAIARPGTYLLSGLVTCIHCGNPMYGVRRK